jgi:hypothetical protein
VSRSKRPELEPLKVAGLLDSPFEGGSSRRLQGDVRLSIDLEARQRDIPLHPLQRGNPSVVLTTQLSIG